MDRGHTAGHETGAIGHTHRARYVESVEAGTGLSELVEIRGTQHRMARGAEKIGTMLIGDEQDEIWRFGSQANSPNGNCLHGACSYAARRSNSGDHTSWL